MSNRRPDPGVSREQRISDDGLERLRKQLDHGARIARPVLQQWIKRYGDAARKLIEQHGYRLED